MKVHIIQQEAWVEAGEYLAWAERNGFAVSFTRCWMHDRVPREADADLLIVLGGWQNPKTTAQECDYFDSAAQQALIRTYASRGRAVIGVCLGAQLVGEALGAPYAHSPEREIGPVRARLTARGREDTFLRAFPDAFDAGEWHNDMPGLTDDAEVLAESGGCPRQIVRYGRYIYGFQTHMEFTHEIIAAGLRDIGGEPRVPGRFVQSAAELLAYDYTAMNRLLSSFLDAMAADYAAHAPASPERLLEKMISFSEGSIHDIDHLIKVWAYAKTIGRLEGLGAETQYILEAAAITHDIACPLCRRKYGSAEGVLQEKEGAPMVRAFLADTGMTRTQIDRIAYLVGHHHTLTGVEGSDWQILIEADFIVNASENGYDRQRVLTFIERHMKTETGIRLCREVLRP